MQDRIVQVLLPLPFGRGFDYLVPEALPVSLGDVVRVPFGKKEMVGVVWGEGQNVAAEKIKPLIGTADTPPMAARMREFLDWVAWYNMAEPGSVLKMALPLPDAFDPPKRARKTVEETHAAPQPPSLSEAQHQAATALSARLDEGYSTTLLDGVTGSGKTEVYFDMIANALERGEGQGQILVLLPEIALSVQWLARFERRFGFLPQVWHSGITRAAKKHTYRKVASGVPCVVVGARSALFLPFQALRMIVVDEEHEPSFKQEDGVFYQARDMAVARAHLENIPILLVSATPSLETVVNVSRGRYRALLLPERHRAASMPEASIVNMKDEALAPDRFISAPVQKALAETLAKRQQGLLFLNRRGYAPLVLCRACGHRFQCGNCTAWLVMHKRTHGITLRCHHCDHREPAPKLCPECGSEDSLHPCGPGVERLAEEVAERFPTARLAVLSSDHATLEGKEATLAEALVAIEQNRVDLIIGTQMLAKGHHFPSLAVVAIIDADLGLAGGDLRAGERTFQLLQQIAGRAGRETHVPGRVWLQTFFPDHPVLAALVNGDREAFIALEKAQRKQSGMPPYGRLAALILDGSKEDEVRRFAGAMAGLAPRLDGVDILGPAPAPITLLRGRYRYRLLVRTELKVKIQDVLAGWLATLPLQRAVRIRVDIDPQSFY